MRFGKTVAVVCMGWTAGVVGRDNRTLTISENGGGYCTGEVLSANEIELIYMQDGSPYSISIDSFKRV